MRKSPRRIIAVDWSGAKKGFKKKIWLAQVGADGLEVLNDGFSREGIRDLLIKESEGNPDLVVGLDFAFSFPSWFVQKKNCDTGPKFWEVARNEGEEWLAERKRPFFTKGGWPGEFRRAYRTTEWDLNEQGQRAETVFKLVGPTQVGPGSIRGMPILQDLSRAGFNIWPFDPPEMPFVVEIYPRLFYGQLTKTKLEDRVGYLKRYRDLDEIQRIQASCSDDAFDATVSSFEMFDRRDELLSLPAVVDDTSKLEGLIWS